MTDLAQNFHPVLLALVGTCFTWGMTALGAAVVFTHRNLSRKVLDTMLGFAAGVMITASFWSLLAPAIEMMEGQPLPAWCRRRWVSCWAVCHCASSIGCCRICTSDFQWKKLRA